MVQNLNGCFQTFKGMEAVIKSVASVILAYTGHYGATKLYNYACVPNGIVGFMTGIFSVGSPICQVGVQVISNTQVSYSSMILMGASRLLVDMALPGFSDTVKPVTN
jgi:hypothetical protein